MSRLANCITNAINSKTRLPKWCVIVVEDDLIKDPKIPPEAYQKMIDWIMCEHEKATTRFRSFLPQKAKKYMWPLMLWLIPTLHVNYNNFQKRKSFIAALREAADDHNVALLPLRQVWCHTDSTLFTARQQQYTNGGLNVIWSAIDRAVKYADQRYHRNPGKALHELFINDKQEEDNIKQSEEQAEDAAIHHDFIPNFFRNHSDNERNTRNTENGIRLPAPTRRRLDYL